MRKTLFRWLIYFVNSKTYWATRKLDSLDSADDISPFRLVHEGNVPCAIFLPKLTIRAICSHQRDIVRFKK